MTNIGNEFGQVLNCVLTTGEGAAIDELCQGVVKRYKDAGQPEPQAIYVDNHCCNDTGMWSSTIKFRMRYSVFLFYSLSHVGGDIHM